MESESHHGVSEEIPWSTASPPPPPKTLGEGVRAKEGKVEAQRTPESPAEPHARSTGPWLYLIRYSQIS